MRIFNHEKIIKETHVSFLSVSPVGKSFIIKRACSKLWSLKNDDYQATIGLGFNVIPIDCNDQTVKIKVWEIPSDVRFQYQPAIDSTLIKSSFVVLCFDGSLSELEMEKQLSALKEKLTNQLKEKISQIKIIWVATKMCLLPPSKKEITTDELLTRQSVISQLIKKLGFASQNPIFFTSAKEDNVNIKSIFTHIAVKTVDKLCEPFCLQEKALQVYLEIHSQKNESKQEGQDYQYKNFWAALSDYQNFRFKNVIKGFTHGEDGFERTELLYSQLIEIKKTDSFEKRKKLINIFHQNFNKALVQSSTSVFSLKNIWKVAQDKMTHTYSVNELIHYIKMIYHRSYSPPTTSRNSY